MLEHYFVKPSTIDKIRGILAWLCLLCGAQYVLNRLRHAIVVR